MNSAYPPQVQPVLSEEEQRKRKRREWLYPVGAATLGLAGGLGLHALFRGMGKKSVEPQPTTGTGQTPPAVVQPKTNPVTPQATAPYAKNIQEGVLNRQEEWNAERETLPHAKYWEPLTALGVNQAAVPALQGVVKPAANTGRAMSVWKNMYTPFLPSQLATPYKELGSAIASPKATLAAAKAAPGQAILKSIGPGFGFVSGYNDTETDKFYGIPLNDNVAGNSARGVLTAGLYMNPYGAIGKSVGDAYISRINRNTQIDAKNGGDAELVGSLASNLYKNKNHADYPNMVAAFNNDPWVKDWITQFLQNKDQLARFPSTAYAINRIRK